MKPRSSGKTKDATTIIHSAHSGSVSCVYTAAVLSLAIGRRRRFWTFPPVSPWQFHAENAAITIILVAYRDARASNHADMGYVSIDGPREETDKVFDDGYSTVPEEGNVLSLD